MATLLVLHGPNLNLLGTREPDLYGADTLDAVLARLTALAIDLGVHLETFQSNHEGALIDRLHAAMGEVDGGVHAHECGAARCVAGGGNPVYRSAPVQRAPA